MLRKLSQLFSARQHWKRSDRSGRRRAAQPQRYVPTLEMLEGRDMLSTLTLIGPSSSTYGDQVTYTADLNPALGSSGPANGMMHLFVDNVEKASHAVAASDFSNGDAV